MGRSDNGNVPGLDGAQGKGVNGYISIKNASPFDMVVNIQAELKDAIIVFPDKATKIPI